MQVPDADAKVRSDPARVQGARTPFTFWSTAASQARTHQYRLGYRGDIEGLRALAILLVIADHAGLPWLRGGFVGVDIFFVLSGYLITALLVQDVARTGRIRIAVFYARRLRRLLPALLMMLVVVSLVAMVLLAPASQSDQAPTAASAVLWLSNLRFAFATLDYFGPQAENNLFLHTWSLGVEEQFYLVWPALLALVLGAWGKHKPLADVNRLKFAMIAIMLISVVACIAWTPLAPQMTFYMMPTRAWQFALGALTLIYSGAPKQFAADEEHGLVAPDIDKARRLVRWAGWLGIALVLVAAAWFDPDEPYPGWRALLPSLGAAGVLAAGARASGTGIARVLSWHPLQAIGRISYSWYLWHWPVLILGGTLVSTADSAYRLILVGCSLLLAVLSHRFVEMPIRGSAGLIERPRLFVLASLAVMVVGWALASGWSMLAMAWMKAPQQNVYQDARDDAPLIYLQSLHCDDFFFNDKVNACVWGPADATHTVVLMGDSLAGQWFPSVAKAFDRPGWRLLVLTKSACPMVNRHIFYKRIGREYTECDTWRTRAFIYLTAVKPDVVILSSNPSAAFDEQQWVDGTSEILRAIGGSVGHIVLLRATPHLPFDGPDCLSMKQWRPSLLARMVDCQAPAYSRQNAKVYEWLLQAAGLFSNVSVLDMNDLVCPRGMCDAERNGQIIFRDNQHLTASFAGSLGNDLAQRLGAQDPH